MYYWWYRSYANLHEPPLLPNFFPLASKPRPLAAEMVLWDLIISLIKLSCMTISLIMYFLLKLNVFDFHSLTVKFVFCVFCVQTSWTSQRKASECWPVLPGGPRRVNRPRRTKTPSGGSSARTRRWESSLCSLTSQSGHTEVLTASVTAECCLIVHVTTSDAAF